jgi:hypothetical protein
MDLGTEYAFSSISAIEEAIKAHPEDGPIYEDQSVMVIRKNGTVYITGKPIRVPFIYA